MKEINEVNTGTGGGSKHTQQELHLGLVFVFSVLHLRVVCGVCVCVVCV